MSFNTSDTVNQSDEIDQLLTALKDGDVISRCDAASKLGELRNVRAIEPLILSLKDENEYVAELASIALAKIGEPAVLPLIETLNKENEKGIVVSGIIWALGEIADQRAFEPIINFLNSSNGIVRFNVVRALGNLKMLDAVNLLINALQDEKFSVRASAAHSLGQLGSKLAVEPLVFHLLKDTDLLPRIEAASSLGKLGDERALRPLTLVKEDNIDGPQHLVLVLKNAVTNAIEQIEKGGIIK